MKEYFVTFKKYSIAFGIWVNYKEIMTRKRLDSILEYRNDINVIQVKGVD